MCKWLWVVIAASGLIILVCLGLLSDTRAQADKPMATPTLDHYVYFPLITKNYFFQHRQGGWVVTGTEVIQGGDIRLEGNLIVQSGGNLTLRHVLLTLNGTFNGQYGIQIQSGGAITIEAGSSISAARDTGRFTFVAEVGSRFVMRDSELHGCGWGAPYGEGTWYDDRGGLAIHAANALLDGNLFSDNFIGAILYDAADARITDNQFLRNTWGGLSLLNAADTYVADNIFTDSYSGIWSGSSRRNVITRNSFSRHQEGAVWMFYGWDNEFSANYVSAAPGIAIAHVSGNNRVLSNTVTGDFLAAIIHSTNNTIQGNTVMNERSWGVMLEYATHNLIADNRVAMVGGDGITQPDDSNIAALYLHHASDNLLVNNVISAVNSSGILLWGSSTTNTVQSNAIASTRRGIALHYAADRNTVVSNTVSTSEQPSVVVEASSGNHIHHNNFVGSGRVPYDDTGGNLWDDGSAGNYWSHYTGDGITPFLVPPLGIDHHPLVTMPPAVMVSVPVFSPVPQAPNPYTPSLQITGPTSIAGGALVVDSDLSIEAGGSLTLTNVTVRIEADTTSGIHVQTGGALYIYHSDIRPTSPEHGGFLFQVMPGSEFVMKDSRLSGAGVWPGSGDWSGLDVLTPYSVIENNVITDTYGGIALAGAGGITGQRVVSNTVSQCHFCISLNYNELSYSNTITGNSVFWGLGYGIRAQGVYSSLVAGNHISQTWLGGLRVQGVDNQVVGNTVAHSEDGLVLSGWQNILDRNYLSGIRRNSFLMWGLSRNTFVGNTIADSYTELELDASTAGNVVYRNAFINNTNPSHDQGSNNQWDNGRQGNYWSRYTGLDADGDGIGDTPYVISPNGVDRYPLMVPYEGAHRLTRDWRTPRPLAPNVYLGPDVSVLPNAGAGRRQP